MLLEHREELWGLRIRPISHGETGAFRRRNESL
jgi:hypothetical protein